MMGFGEKFVGSIYKVSVIFTVMMLITLGNGRETVSHRTILGNMIIALLLVLVRGILFFEKAVSQKQYYTRLIISFTGCFIIYLTAASLIGINDMTQWTIGTWSFCIVLYTATSVIIWLIFTARHKHDVQMLNIKLNKLKQ
ncbi:MAG: DUF3021 family protein [Bacillota bacterium]|nr:DUF3021 family protein [Bacillota bacterium]